MSTISRAAKAVGRGIRAVAGYVVNEQPAAVAGFFTAVVALVAGVKSGHLDIGLVVAVWSAAQGLIVRSVVTPTGKLPDPAPSDGV